ncbi:cytochrome P450 [Pseudomassariella vexata]|uniref:Cytochrome P450 n=1 Tax=Pseudomassariella vexata TaxID=1141098 RepID=A0A1Y2EEE4_9PEZI|nr:cytochrome P450 [Pseudomassariella vexata]ORY69940.1 cytochrome P450 [Pseudomassariella vexata]
MESLPKDPRDIFKVLSPLALGAQLLLIALVVVLVRRRYLSSISDIPGPKWAALTRLWHINQIWSGHQNLTFLDLHKKHGHFVRIGPNEVSVTHPDAIKKLILTPQRKGYWYQIMRFPDWRFITPLSTTEPKEKVERSRQLASAYAMSNVIKSEELIGGLISKLTGWMDKHADAREPMDLASFFTYTAFDVVGELVFSKPFGFLDQGIDIDNSISQAIGLECYVSIAGYFQWLHNILVANPFLTWLDIMPTNYLSTTSNKALEARRANQDARFDFVAHWLKAHEQNPDRLTYRDVGSACMANVGAGSDTVSCVLQSFVYHALRHPSVWNSVRQEIDEARCGGLCTDDVISYADALKLPYLQACLKETMRIFHPIALGSPRIVPEGGLTIDDHTFREGTILSLNVFAMNLSTDIWGPDAKQFKPERWLGKDAAVLEKHFIPFSGGISTCPGQHLARIELSKILATIVRDYDIWQVNPDQEWHYHAYFTTVPGNWPVYIKKRKAQ